MTIYFKYTFENKYSYSVIYLFKLVVSVKHFNYFIIYETFPKLNSLCMYDEPSTDKSSPPSLLRYFLFIS